MSELKRCAIFYVSDGTAITAETVGRSLITQFTGIEFIEKRLPFINDKETAQAAADIIRNTPSDYQHLVINTVVDLELRKIIHSAGGLKLDVIDIARSNQRRRIIAICLDAA